MSQIKAISSKQCAALIKAVGNKRTVIIEGGTGIGKSSIHHHLAKDPAFAGYISTMIDCTNLSDGSVWMPDVDSVRGVSREVPNERFGISEENRWGVEGAKPVLVCLDELGKARQFIKDTLAPLVYERRIGEYKFPEGSIVFATTNLSDEGLGDSFLGHMRNRLAIVRMRPPTKDEWVNDFAIPAGVREEVIAAAHQHPRVFESFMDYRAGGINNGQKLAAQNPFIYDPSNAGQLQFVTPRSLHAASDIVAQRAHFDQETLEAALAGVVGAPFAAEIVTLMRFGDRLPAFEQIVKDPEGTPMVDNIMSGVVQCYQFMKNARAHDEVEACSVYVSRMKEELKSLFVTTIGSNNDVLANFGHSKTFANLLREHRKYLGQ